MSESHRYIIGIDLGTTNSAISYIDTDTKVDIKTFKIPQLVQEGSVKNLKTLPSFLYLLEDYELNKGTFTLPWKHDSSYIVGELARVHGAFVPSRLISSAKSWLCHSMVNRKAAILPWGRDSDGRRLSPVEASSCYLRHIRDAWNHVIADGDERSHIEKQQVIITIPASFDETARELTTEAAEIADIKNFTLLEEPQAAFYSWIYSHKNDWTDTLDRDRLILVIDIGGGTTDFNLIFYKNNSGKPQFERIAVGDHIMLGGDNMDLSLARNVEIRMTGKRSRLGFEQWLSLAHQCRMIKEEILNSDEKDSMEISILGRGSSVISGSLKEEITRAEVEETILEGFFKGVRIGDEIEREKRSGLKEMGLPYVYDTSVIKHISSFLKMHSVNKKLNQVIDKESGLSIVRPDMVLFNGGVFKAKLIRDRVVEVLKEWFVVESQRAMVKGQDKKNQKLNDQSLTLLENENLDLAVSAGAVYYGLVKRGEGVRISGGTGKAYYIAVGKGQKTEVRSHKSETNKSKINLVCIVPRGMEEGGEIHLSSPEFEVITNSPASFSVYSSSYRMGDKAGHVITEDRDSLLELPHIRTVLHFGKKRVTKKIPVSLGVKLNEYGTLDVWCESKETPHRWKLEFQSRKIRENERGQKAEVKEKRAEVKSPADGNLYTVDEATVDKAVGLIDIVFSTKSSTHDKKDMTVENLTKNLCRIFGLDRTEWPLFAIRKMWDGLIRLKKRRDLTARYEARWLNLSGFLLRPGFGYPLDDWRIEELWRIFTPGLKHQRDAQCRSEWWIMWRRVGGGLNDKQQRVLFNKISSWITTSDRKKPARISGSELTELWMLAASLEHLDTGIKSDLGSELIRIIKKGKSGSTKNYLWALSRIGARIPFYGTTDKVVPKEKVEEWAKELLKVESKYSRDSAYAITQLSRRTDDRTRDISDSLRRKIVERLSAHDWAARFVKEIEEAVPIDRKEENDIFGESLPVGLYIS